jgi:hypothetical protein
MVMVMSLSEPEFQAWNASESQFPKDGPKKGSEVIWIM